MTSESAFLAHYLDLIETGPSRATAAPHELAPRLVEAMRYATLGGGKRISPLLTCATAASLGADPAHALAPACAVEFIHAYSLIHDDLPAMDDDDLRRGRPTVHVAFGEAVAILAGDALQALAFETISGDASLPLDARVAMIELLARAAGWNGMVGGQTFDMDATGRASVDRRARVDASRENRCAADDGGRTRRDRAPLPIRLRERALRDSARPSVSHFKW